MEYTTTKPPQECLETAWAHLTRGTWRHPGTVSKTDGSVTFRAPDRWPSFWEVLLSAGLVFIMGKGPGPHVTLTASTWSDGLTHLTISGDDQRLVEDLESWVPEALDAEPVANVGGVMR